MWVRFPPGVTGLSMHQQQFGPEVQDEQGRMYARVPPHFAPHITALNLGYEFADPEATDLPDLPKFDPERDEAIEVLTRENEGLKAEISSMRTDFGQMTASLAALANQRDELQAKIHQLEAELEDLKEEKDNE